MKGFLLAAGLGTRLRPLTDNTPKCMLPVGGTTLLDLWLDAFHKAGVDDVLVNTHYLPDMVRLHIQQRTGPPDVRTFFEPELLGSAGTLVANRRWVANEDSFIVCYADNLTDFDLSTLIEFHRESGTVASLTAFHTQQPSACGILELDGSQRLVGFEEKPESPTSDLANAGMYAFDPSVLEDIGARVPSDIGYHLLPRLVGRARVLRVEGYFHDIGTPSSYRLAQLHWPARTLQ